MNRTILLEGLERFLTALGAADAICALADLLAAWLAGGAV